MQELEEFFKIMDDKELDEEEFYKHLNFDHEEDGAIPFSPQ